HVPEDPVDVAVTPPTVSWLQTDEALGPVEGHRAPQAQAAGRGPFEVRLRVTAEGWRDSAVPDAREPVLLGEEQVERGAVDVRHQHSSGIAGTGSSRFVGGAGSTVVGASPGCTARPT